MELVNALSETYIEAFSSVEGALLQSVNEYTIQHHPHAHMLSGKVQGQFLSMISQLMQPKRILEVGTFTGYSALCLAQGLHKDGKLYTLELRKEDAATAQQFFDRSEYKDQLILKLGNAKDIIPTLNETWDIVFIDADKTGYIDYYELILPAVRPNGLIIADNILFHGQVLEPEITGKNAKAIHAFNEHVRNDERVQQVLLTVRDGLSLIRKV
ncbi:MAG: O-methyltransferase [Chitinophagaceae bacterium]|nr:O-methyltransferase [Chitinophagaceae bacterium]